MPPAQAPAAPAPTQQFIARLQASWADASFVRLVLGKPQGEDPTLDKVLGRRLLLRGVDHLSLVWRHRSKDITKNLPWPEALAELSQWLGASDGVGAQFHHAHLVTRSHDIQLVRGRKGDWGLRVGKQAPSADTATATPAAHDRQRQYDLSLDTPFLAALGVTDAQHRLVPTMARKWRQINKFVEVLGHAIGQSPLATRDAAQPVRVLDFGAGKGYLTFAVHHQLLAQGRVPDVIGVELRPDLTGLCNQAATGLGLTGLHFATGDVRSVDAQTAGPIDIMIALHACDTATDVAMHRGVASGAAIILCSPCCHKELRPQITAPLLLQPMLRHGIHMTEQAEMLTDSLRALLLQASGYDTQVFEFISPEHTGKNKMVMAVRRAHPLPAEQRTRLLQQVSDLKAHYGVQQQTLEMLLSEDRNTPRESSAALPRS